MHVLSDRTVLKVSDLTENDNEFNHLINLQVINGANGHVLARNTENIGMFRIKKTQTNSNYIGVLLIHQFSGNNNCIQLYDTTSLKLVTSIELTYRPVDMYMSENAIYVMSNKNNSFIHKYGFDLKQLKSFGQSSKEKEPFYIPKYFKLESVVREESGEQKLYFVDYEHLKVRIMSESTGKYLKKISMVTGGQFSGSGSKNILIQIDSGSQRIVMLNKKQFRITVLNWDGMLLSQREVDAGVQAIDKFFLVKDNAFAVVDSLNQLVHFF